MKSGISLVTVMSCLWTSTAPAQEGTHGHHDFPGAVTGFHSVLAPVWHAPTEDVRRLRACASSVALQEHAKVVIADPAPAVVDGGAWRSAAAGMKAQSDTLRDACRDQEPAKIDSVISSLHGAFHQLVALIGHRH